MELRRWFLVFFLFGYTLAIVVDIAGGIAGLFIPAAIAGAIGGFSSSIIGRRLEATR